MWTCNSRISLANLHAVLNFVHVNKCRKDGLKVRLLFATVSKNYSNPFSKFSKANRVPHAIWVNLHAVLYQFAQKAQITCGAVAKGNPLDSFVCGNQKLHAKNVSWKNFKYIYIKMTRSFRDLYTQQDLSNYTTFRTILSGATVPLTY